MTPRPESARQAWSSRQSQSARSEPPEPWQQIFTPHSQSYSARVEPKTEFGFDKHDFNDAFRPDPQPQTKARMKARVQSRTDPAKQESFDETIDKWYEQFAIGIEFDYDQRQSMATVGGLCHRCR